MTETPRQNLKSLILVSALPFLSACGLFSDGGNGLANVDELVSRIQRVHVDAELAQQQVQTAMDQLEAMVAPGFVGNPVMAHAELTKAVEQSTQQAATLRDSYQSMQEAADPVFDRWAEDLGQFTNLTMRQRSEARMQQTRSRYEAIVAAVGPALSHYDAINRSLNDQTLFLGHDFNSSAVSDIRDDVHMLAAQVKALDGELGSCLAAARTYLDAATMPTPEQPVGPPAEPVR